MAEIYFREESYKIIGACMKVHAALGPGFLEAVYQEALEKEFTTQSIPFKRQHKLPVYYNDIKLKKYYVADFLCYNQVVVEIKAVEFMPKAHYSQLLNSLKAINLKLGILVNFGAPSLTYKRLLNPSLNSQKFAQIRDIPMAPVEEQTICVGCGFCCDGTLFLHAHLNPGERGSLPDKIEENCFTEKDKDYFRLPCQYFSGKCTIYDRKRADVCSSYRCQLLKDFAEGKLFLSDALETVRDARNMRYEVIEEYRKISGNSDKINFRQLLLNLGKIPGAASEGKPLSMDYEMLLARCNILEALLIKHFRSAEDFEKIIMK